LLSYQNFTFERKKCPSEKELYKIWQPDPRGLLIYANDTEVFKKLIDAGIKFSSGTRNGQQEWFTKEHTHDLGAT